MLSPSNHNRTCTKPCIQPPSYPVRDTMLPLQKAKGLSICAPADCDVCQAVTATTTTTEHYGIHKCIWLTHTHTHANTLAHTLTRLHPAAWLLLLLLLITHSYRDLQAALVQVPHKQVLQHMCDQHRHMHQLVTEPHQVKHPREMLLRKARSKRPAAQLQNRKGCERVGRRCCRVAVDELAHRLVAHGETVHHHDAANEHNHLTPAAAAAAV